MAAGGFEDTFNNILEGISGSCAKGFFVFPNYKSGAGMGSNARERARTAMDAKQIEEASAKAQKEILKKAKRMLDDDSGTLATSKNSKNFSAEDMTVSDFITYEVQYNPSTISLRSTSGTRRQKLYGAQGETKYDTVQMPVVTDLSMTLIFEAINNSNAFVVSSETPLSLTGDTLINGTSNLVNQGSSLLSGDSAKNPSYSVRKNVQGFMALMTRTGWRHVTFYYGMQCFRGVLVAVRPQYKMFNKAGEPILAEVAVTIRQDTSRALDNDMWYESFHKKANDDESAAGNS